MGQDDGSATRCPSTARRARDGERGGRRAGGHAPPDSQTGSCHRVDRTYRTLVLRDAVAEIARRWHFSPVLHALVLKQILSLCVGRQLPGARHQAYRQPGHAGVLGSATRRPLGAMRSTRAPESFAEHASRSQPEALWGALAGMERRRASADRCSRTARRFARSTPRVGAGQPLQREPGLGTCGLAHGRAFAYPGAARSHLDMVGGGLDPDGGRVTSAE